MFELVFEYNRSMELTDITTAIADLGDPQLWRSGDRELANLLPVVTAAIHTLEAMRLRLIREITDRPVHVGGDKLYADTAAWMADTSVVSCESARRLTRLADALARHP